MKQVDRQLELPRLSESGDPALTRLVAGLRDNGPDPSELGALASQLAAMGVGVTAPPPDPSVARGAWKKWALGGGGAATALVAWFALREPVTPPGFAAAFVPVAPAPRSEKPPEPRRLQSPASRGLLREAPGVSAPPATSAPGMAALLPPPQAASAASVTAAPLAPATPAQPGRQRHGPRVESASRSDSVVAAGRPVTAPELPSGSSAPTEIELLRDARLALNGAPVRALELTESHARTYPSGRLTQERELMAITALVALGRRTAALSRASRFEQSFPQSPYRKQIGELLR